MTKDEFMVLFHDGELDLETVADSYWDLNEKCGKLINENESLKKRHDRNLTLLSNIQNLFNEDIRKDY